MAHPGAAAWCCAKAVPDAVKREVLRRLSASGVSMLADVAWDRRSMVIFAVALSVGLGLQLEPGALQHLPDTPRILLTSGLLPAAGIAIALNLALPDPVTEDQMEEVSGGMAGQGKT